MLDGWSAHLILHVIGDCFFLHNRLGLRCLYLNWSFFEHGWLLRHLPRHCLPWLLGPFMFLESWRILSKQCLTYTIILVFHGTQLHDFLVSEQDSGGSTRRETHFIFCLFRNNEHPFPGWSFLSSRTYPYHYSILLLCYLGIYEHLICIKYRVAMMTSVLELSQYITYRMDYNYSTRSCCHYYYISFGNTSSCCIGMTWLLSVITACHFLSLWMT